MPVRSEEARRDAGGSADIPIRDSSQDKCSQTSMGNDLSTHGSPWTAPACCATMAPHLFPRVGSISSRGSSLAAGLPRELFTQSEPNPGGPFNVAGVEM